ncbi:hypothetical protein IL992_19360 [Microbispora sp. NEAU-D428]|uniref:hypothetical protein n=1 Tax=Microbispora sitophila TaxID=2771537 RepID=UPI00186869D4|nr:hypothetical protein [Microbispora sitophila]MBE3011337.1 hypothetical protein [Microbispora sitophila]
MREYPHVQGFYLPITGYFPLSPWAGFGVLCAYAALALWAAATFTRRQAPRRHAPQD